MSKSQVAVWFEIPAANFERAVTFYQMLFAITLHQEVVNEEKSLCFLISPRQFQDVSSKDRIISPAPMGR